LSQFEYITVLTSFVVAVGVSQLISGWGRLYLNRHTAAPYPLQVMASVLLLVALLQSIWGYWGFRNVDWDFGRFIAVLSPLLPLVGATYLVIPPEGGTPSASKSPREHYFAVHRVIFSLLAAWVALGTAAELALVEPALHLGQMVRVVAVILLLALGLTVRPALHWAGLAVLVTLQLLFVGIVTPTLD
jgi:hypothetical protein